MSIQIEVKTCSDCPFLTDSHALCQLRPKKENRDYMDDRDRVEYIESKGYVIPEWCPLKKDEILIKIKQ